MCEAERQAIDGLAFRRRQAQGRRPGRRYLPAAPARAPTGGPPSWRPHSPWPETGRAFVTAANAAARPALALNEQLRQNPKFCFAVVRSSCPGGLSCAECLAYFYDNQLILPVCPPLAVLVACALRVLRAHGLPWAGVRWISG
jgi:hypothetical protein